ncbi:MAG TPA: hypothetical protein VFQ47_05655, partial [Nitrososphaera sp.]|nr:hypothetical protein [Nitrososphaera sp.]
NMERTSRANHSTLIIIQERERRHITSFPRWSRASGARFNARINPRRAPATTYDARKHDEKNAVEASG